MSETPNVSSRPFVPDFLDIGDGDEMAVPGSRNQARKVIAGECGVAYVDVKVRRAWMRPCDCEGCEDDGPDKTHGYDSYWVFCEKPHPEAVAWWIG